MISQLEILWRFICICFIFHKNKKSNCDIELKTFSKKRKLVLRLLFKVVGNILSRAKLCACLAAENRRSAGVEVALATKHGNATLCSSGRVCFGIVTISVDQQQHGLQKESCRRSFRAEWCSLAAAAAALHPLLNGGGRQGVTLG